MNEEKVVKKSGSALSVIAILLSLLSLLAVAGSAYWFKGQMNKVGLSIDGVKKSADESKAETEKLNAGINKINVDINGLSNQIADAKGAFSKVAPRLDTMDNTLGGFKTQTEGIKNDLMGNFAEGKKQLEGAINDNQTKLDELKDQMKDAISRYDAINDNVAKLTERITAAESKMGELSNELGGIKQAASEEKDSAENYFGKAEKFYSQREWDRATKFYDKAINLKPDWAVAYENRGMAKFQAEDYQGAIEDFDKTRKLDPTRTDAVDKFMDEAKAKLKKQKK